MRLVFFILIFFAFTPSFAVQETPIIIIEVIDDGGKNNFRKKKHRKKHFVKVNRTKIELKKAQKFDIKKRTKGKAILMAVLTGPLGGHRLYLGTKPYVPIVYALTLGGGLGLLPAVDIVVIILTNDLTQYYNNPQIMMW